MKVVARCAICRDSREYPDLPRRCAVCGAAGGMRTVRVASTAYEPDRSPRTLRREDWAGRRAAAAEEAFTRAAVD